MRKRIVGPHRAEAGGESEQGWLDLKQIATVEVTWNLLSSQIQVVGKQWRL
jgi:hypothetical protein